MPRTPNDLGIPGVQLAPGETGFTYDVIRRAVIAGGPAFFPRHRWFGDKTRTIASTSLRDLSFAVLVTGEPERIALTIVDVQFLDGGSELYFVPLALIARGLPAARTLAILEHPDGVDCLDDAITHPAFHAWLLDPVASPSVVPGRHSHVEWRPGPSFDARLAAADGVGSRLSGAEQSNSAIIYGHDLLVKVFRKLRPGINPDIEISRFLTAFTEFRNFPELLGDFSLESDNGGHFSLGMTLPYIPNLGDAWDYLQSRLLDLLLGTAVELDLVAPFRRLGRRTGQLHQALATPTIEDAFAAEPISPLDVRGWAISLADSLDRTVAALRARVEMLPPGWDERLGGLSSRSASLAARIAGFEALEQVEKIRVHGDFHLGQVLVTPNEDFVILDFEGEPSRQMAERRAKTSPLKDVAGMLRSFAYARAAALRARPPEIPVSEAEDRLATWEANARDAFLAGYRETTYDEAAPFLPRDPVALNAALGAWELDKAVYEINYELNNRPDWLALPLATLLDPSSGL